jgi:hypothetical protein
MIDRLILSAVLGITGWNGLYPAEPPPLTASQLQVKAKHKSVSDLCAKKRKSQKVKEICQRWESHELG